MKIIKPILVSISLLLGGGMFVQPAYTAPPPPVERALVDYDFSPDDAGSTATAANSSLAVTSTVTSISVGQEGTYRVYLPVIVSHNTNMTNQIAEIIKLHPVVRDSGTRLLGIEIEGEAAVIDLSREILPGGRFDPTPFRQLSQALNKELGLHKKYMLTFKVEGKMLDQWGMPVPTIEPILNDSITIQSGPLAGKKIALNPGHGYYYTGSDWAWQRGLWWGIREDLVNAEMQMYVAQYLSNAGATVIYLREPDKNAGTGDSGLPRWKEAARHYLKYRDAPGSVWNPPMSSCSIGPINLCKDLMARPYGANYYGADLLISLHNNGGGGTGTETYYDTVGTYHSPTAALNLAQKVHTRVINNIHAQYDSGWVDRTVKGRAGNYGENYFAQMPAILIEVAFMDTKSPDNDALQDEEFKQLVAEAIVLGICDYYGVSCPNVTDPTPPTTTISLSGIVGESNWYRSDVQVTLAASDNSGGSGVKLIQYRIDSGSWQTYSIPFIVSGEEEHTVSYKAQDNADNWEDEKQTTLGIDTTAPSGTLAINNNASVTHASLVYLNATTTDNLSGVSKMRIRNASGSWTDWQSYTSQQLWQLSGSTGQIFGVEIQFKDRAGNGSIVYSDTILLDIYPDRPASTGYRLAKSTLGVSGGPSTSTGYQLRGTSGQPSTVSIMTGANYISAWGYWRAALVSSPTQPGAVYLPIILKQP